VSSCRKYASWAAVRANASRWVQRGDLRESDLRLMYMPSSQEERRAAVQLLNHCSLSCQNPVECPGMGLVRSVDLREVVVPSCSQDTEG
jgi:hypothetical protein